MSEGRGEERDEALLRADVGDGGALPLTSSSALLLVVVVAVGRYARRLGATSASSCLRFRPDDEADDEARDVGGEGVRACEVGGEGRASPL